MGLVAFSQIQAAGREGSDLRNMIWRFKPHLWSVIIRDTELLDVYSECEHREFESIADAHFCQSLSPAFLGKCLLGVLCLLIYSPPCPFQETLSAGSWDLWLRGRFRFKRKKTFQPAKNFAVTFSNVKLSVSC